MRYSTHDPIDKILIFLFENYVYYRITSAFNFFHQRVFFFVYFRFPFFSIFRNNFVLYRPIFINLHISNNI